jgi:hypothetical protein
MIWISKVAGGILLQQDATEIVIDAPAVSTALGPIIAELIGSGRALGQARREGYEDGLTQGRINAAIEHATSERIAERQAGELVDALIGTTMASAA